jgi:hypothetical protein
MMFIHQQQPQFQQQPMTQSLTSPSFMFANAATNFHPTYANNPPMPQQAHVFIRNRPCPPQPWILSPSPSSSLPSSASVPMPSFIASTPTTFHHIQSAFPIAQSQSSFNLATGLSQPSFSGGTSMSQSSFSGGTHPSQSMFGNGTGIPQPSFSGGTALLKRKSHYLDESNFESSVSQYLISSSFVCRTNIADFYASYLVEYYQ